MLNTSDIVIIKAQSRHLLVVRCLPCSTVHYKTKNETHTLRITHTHTIGAFLYRITITTTVLQYDDLAVTFELERYNERYTYIFYVWYVVVVRVVADTSLSGIYWERPTNRSFTPLSLSEILYSNYTNK